MGDRQDIDALLVGALYGELDGDDRARLDAHLASHPADRAALDGLRSTRDTLRDTGFTAAFGQLEPSASISAKLLQEAARRAPAAPVGEGLLSWFSNLFRPLGRHPALSAAAALVLVIGVGSMMMRRGEWKTSQPASKTALDQGPREPATVDAPTPSAGSAAPTAAYAVDLDDGLTGGEADGSGDKLAQATGAGRGSAATLTRDLQKDAPATKPSTARVAKPSSPTNPGYLEVDKRGGDVALRSADDGDAEAEGALALSSDESRSDSAPAGAAAREQATTGAGMIGGAPRAEAPPAVAQAAPAPADPGVATAALKKEAENNAWAREQHTRMVKLAQAGKCLEVGPIGVELARKAPEYYQSTVVNDRALRQCISYVDRARKAKAPAPAKSRAGNSSQPDRVQDEINAK